jgi:two-component system, NarL family, invasion response regulator UvrY
MSDVFLVDDHALLRDGMRAVLVEAGHRVTGESSQPTQALAHIQALEPHVVLLDLNLGPHSGFELLEAMQRRKLSVKTISVTMSAHPRHVAEALRLGATGYVLKGSPASEVLQAIQTVLQGRVYLGSDVADPTSSEAPGADDTLLARLSVRERQILVLVARGQSSSTIGMHLHLSPKTVDSYRSRLMAKISAPDVPALVRFAIRTELVDINEH